MNNPGRRRLLFVPHTYLLMLFLALFMALLTYVVPAGTFERELDENLGRQILVEGTFQPAPSKPQGVGDVLSAPVKGIIEAAEIIAFVFVVGGFFGILDRTGALQAGILGVASKVKGQEKLVIPIMMTLFSIGGTTIGMGEEIIPFYLMLLPLIYRLGYDSLVAVGIIFVGSGVGIIGSTFNPFAVGIAQSLVGLAPGSGFAVRAAIWVVLTAISVIYVMRYAANIKANPSSSTVYSLDQQSKDELDLADLTDFGVTPRQTLILTLFAAGIALIISGVLLFGWYVIEIAACFLAMSMIIKFLGNIPANQACEEFAKGAGALIGAALAIGFARGILIIAEDGMILDAILHETSLLMKDWSGTLLSFLLFGFQFFIGCFVPSSSGAAALTVPLTGPLVDISNISQQINVTTYQLGHGIAYIVSPVSPVLMASLSVLKIPWTSYFAFIRPLVLMLISSSLIILATLSIFSVF